MQTDPPSAISDDDAQLRVLLVEDDPDTAALVKAALTRAFPGTQATVIDTLATLGGHSLAQYTLALCDHNLPDGNSFEVIDYIHATRDDLPIIVVTGEHDAFAPPAALEKLAANAPRAEFRVVLEADHFFAAGLAEIGRATFDWLESEAR